MTDEISLLETKTCLRGQFLHILRKVSLCYPIHSAHKTILLKQTAVAVAARWFLGPCIGLYATSKKMAQSCATSNFQMQYHAEAMPYFHTML
jgi:hypothetical protein